MEIIDLGLCFRAPPGAVDGDLSCNHSAQLAVVICARASTGKRVICHVRLVLVIVHVTQVTPANPQRINCLML